MHGEAEPEVKPVQLSKAALGPAAVLQSRQPDLHQPNKQAALQFLAA
jgi:hypothetical protein